MGYPVSGTIFLMLIEEWILALWNSGCGERGVKKRLKGEINNLYDFDFKFQISFSIVISVRMVFFFWVVYRD